ncbi:uncharacterized protein [Antedon mediterranea]|uniref:uncharacterized protein n=1 Tax=Antedon mediterranea TaxID=105859 RepID=UPI003AF53FD5
MERGESSGVHGKERLEAPTSQTVDSMEEVETSQTEVQDASTSQSKGLNKDDLYDFFVVSDDGGEWENRVIKELQKLRSDVTCLSQTDWNPSLFWTANLSKLSKICKMVLVGFTSNPMTKYSEYTAQVMLQRWNSTSMEKLKLIIAKINRDAIIPDLLDGVSVSKGWEKDFYRKILNTLREEVIGVIVKTQNSEQEKPVYNSCVNKFSRLRKFFERFRVILRCIGKRSIILHLAVNDANSLIMLWESHLKEELKKDLAEILEYPASELETEIDEYEYQVVLSKLMENDVCDLYIVSDDVAWEERVIKELKGRKRGIQCLSHEDPSLSTGDLSTPTKKCKTVVVGFTQGHADVSNHVAKFMLEKMKINENMKKAQLIIARTDENAVIPDSSKLVSVINSWDKDFYSQILNTLNEEELVKVFQEMIPATLRYITEGSILFHLAVNDASSLNKLWESHVKKELKKDLAEILQCPASELETEIDEHKYQDVLGKLTEKGKNYTVFWKCSTLPSLSRRFPSFTSLEK